MLQRERRNDEYTRELKRKRYEKYDSEKRRELYKLEKKIEKIDEDAQRYRNYVDGNLVFDVCCVCAFEGPSVDFVPIDEVMDCLENSNYTKSFLEYCIKLSHGNSRDKLFCSALKAELNDLGLLQGFTKVCGECYRQMNRKRCRAKQFTSDEGQFEDEIEDREVDDMSEDEIDEAPCS
jgi:hypothetical protein